MRLPDINLRRPRCPVERGRRAHERADYATALREWLVAAAAGDAEASYRLGLLYARGQGVLASLADAAAHYQRAAEQGHAAAQHELGMLHLDGNRAKGATSFASWYWTAAEREEA